MEDYIIDWVDEHKYENDDGTWSIMDSCGNPYGPRYKTEQELEDVLWDMAFEDPSEWAKAFDND